MFARAWINCEKYRENEINKMPERWEKREKQPERRQSVHPMSRVCIWIFTVWCDGGKKERKKEERDRAERRASKGGRGIKRWPSRNIWQRTAGNRRCRKESSRNVFHGIVDPRPRVEVRCNFEQKGSWLQKSVILLAKEPWLRVKNGLDRIGVAVALLGVRSDKSNGEHAMRQVRPYTA